MKITVYVKKDFIEHFGKLIFFNLSSGTAQEYIEEHSIESLFKDSVTTESAQRTHFQGWLEIQIDYNTYIKLTDLGL